MGFFNKEEDLEEKEEDEEKISYNEWYERKHNKPSSDEELINMSACFVTPKK